MLGRSAGGLYWMFRYLERAENVARLLDVGFRMAVTRGADSPQGDEWRSVLITTGQDAAYREKFDDYTGQQVFNFMLRDRDNPTSVLNMMEQARNNARAVRTGITREVWAATNEGWLELSGTLRRPVRENNLGDILAMIRRQAMLVRGAMEGSMLRNDAFNFARIGTFVERADNTARILDVKYYVLLPSVALVGSDFDNAQWEMVLRSLAGDRAYRWLNPDRLDPRAIVEFLVLDGRFPRSLAFCLQKIRSNLSGLAMQYGEETRAHEVLRDTETRMQQTGIEEIFEQGLHEFLTEYIGNVADIGNAISSDYRFIE
jgi:uncharacterized alpha-E superfamily protein